MKHIRIKYGLFALLVAGLGCETEVPTATSLRETPTARPASDESEETGETTTENGTQDGDTPSDPSTPLPPAAPPSAPEPEAPAPPAPPPPAPDPTPDVPKADFVEQHGVRFSFDQEYPVGQFANGDWWVLGPVTIIAMTPEAADGRNGYEVNPTSTTQQPYDDRIKTYTPALMPALPLLLDGTKSLVKTISSAEAASCQPCLLTAAVLTVLDEIPEDSGAPFFRPPYFGTEKPLYDTRQLKADRLPQLADPVASTPTLEWVARKFERVQLDHKKTWDGRIMHPSQNMADYGAAIGRDVADGALRLLLADSFEQKTPALVAFVQAGLDWYHMLKGGMAWISDGGHSSGRKLPILFAGVVLDRAEILTAVETAPVGSFAEDSQTYYNAGGQALWGHPCSESGYWQKIATDSGRRDCRDPYGQVDGGGAEIGGAYQNCCTSAMWKGHALVARLMPTIKQHWNHEPFFDYVDRWVSSGVIALPDTCSLTVPSPYTGTCVAGGPRFPDRHGINADAGSYTTPFAQAMWAAYR